MHPTPCLVYKGSCEQAQRNTAVAVAAGLATVRAPTDATAARVVGSMLLRHDVPRCAAAEPRAEEPQSLMKYSATFATTTGHL